MVGGVVWSLTTVKRCATVVRRGDAEGEARGEGSVGMATRIVGESYYDLRIVGDDEVEYDVPEDLRGFVFFGREQVLRGIASCEAGKGIEKSNGPIEMVGWIIAKANGRGQ
jgi:hypothetical protein